MVAVVLIVTAIEQLMNVYYRNVLELRGLPQEDITKIIRRCNVDVKIDWLITLVLGHELPKDLKKSITDLVELRNSIVHYKAIPGPLEGDEDSATRILARIENLGFDPLEIPLKLERTLENILEETNPDYKMSKI
ncbi:Uncharacterised protein [uncultured archaeon]|nr:Uncharacterised protein [uncultured archaeon]